MESSVPTRVLVVAHRTAATPDLLEAVRERAARGPCTFTLVVPNPVRGLQRFADPEDAARTEGEAVLERALPLLTAAAGSPVAGLIGVAEPLSAVQDAVHLHGADEIIVSTLDRRASRWLHMDLPSKLKPLGLPVTTVVAGERSPTPA